MSQAAKLQRWVDLLTALLVRRNGITLRDLVEEVPGYRGKTKSALRRTFERDKGELRALGVPIETVGDLGDEETLYRVRPADFYLPYLEVAAARGRAQPRRVDRHGYKTLEAVRFSDADLEALVLAARTAADLGDPALAQDAERAVAKLAIDVGPEAVDAGRVPAIVPGPEVDAGTLSRLTTALLTRKQVRFTYYGIERDETERRTVLPFGLAFTGGHWYLHAQDTARGALRQFRLSRMTEVEVNDTRPGTPDFEIPEQFVLRERAAVRPPWELGDEEATVAEVRFTRSNGWVRSAARLGTRVAGGDGVHRYTVRRRDPFLRWLLSLLEDAELLGPPDLVREHRAMVERTVAANREPVV